MLRAFPPTGFNAYRRSQTRPAPLAARCASRTAEHRKNPANPSKLDLLGFFCVLVVRELSWRPKPNWRKQVVLRGKFGCCVLPKAFLPGKSKAGNGAPKAFSPGEGAERSEADVVFPPQWRSWISSNQYGNEPHQSAASDSAQSRSARWSPEGRITACFPFCPAGREAGPWVPRV